MMYKKIAWYDCEEDEQFSADKLYDCMADNIEKYPQGEYVEGIKYNGKNCELYCKDDCDYTLYEVIEEGCLTMEYQSVGIRNVLANLLANLDGGLRHVEVYVLVVIEAFNADCLLAIYT